MMLKMKTCFLLSTLLLCCEAYKILVVFPMPARSHANLGDGVVRNLLKAGHEVTYITPYEYKNPPANLRQVDVSEIIKFLPSEMMSIKAIMAKEVQIEDHALMVFMMLEIAKQTIEMKPVNKLLNDPNEQFDVVIAEWMFSDLPAGFATVFDCPLIWLSSVDVHWMILNMIEHPSNPAYSIDVMSRYSTPLNFRQRLNELWIQLKVQFKQYMFLDDAQTKEYDRVVAPIVLKRGRQPPSFHDVRYNASLVLANSHVSIGQSISLPQNYKPIGGYHIQETVNPLPEDLKKIMDNAKNGVIYFSMGSNLKSKDMPEEIKTSILKMFGTLKQTVLWKFEEVLPNLPANVHILKWAPQPAILSHPNCILFITHGGLLSTTEAIYFGVPVIGIPVFADQFTNVNRAMSKGFAKRVDLSYTMADEMKAAIEEITTDSRYAAKAKELSLIFHDRPVKPGAELVHWVEHVVRTRGALHLRSPAFYVPFYQKMYLDVVAIVAAILIAVLVLLKRVCAVICPKKKSGSQKKKNN